MGKGPPVYKYPINMQKAPIRSKYQLLLAQI